MGKIYIFQTIAILIIFYKLFWMFQVKGNIKSKRATLRLHHGDIALENTNFSIDYIFL